MTLTFRAVNDSDNDSHIHVSKANGKAGAVQYLGL